MPYHLTFEERKISAFEFRHENCMKMLELMTQYFKNVIIKNNKYLTKNFGKILVMTVKVISFQYKFEKS